MAEVVDTGAGGQHEAPRRGIEEIARLGQRHHAKMAALSIEMGADLLLRDMPDDAPDEIRELASQVRRDVYKLSRHFAPDLPPVEELE